MSESSDHAGTIWSLDVEDREESGRSIGNMNHTIKEVKGNAGYCCRSLSKHSGNPLMQPKGRNQPPLSGCGLPLLIPSAREATPVSVKYHGHVVIGARREA